MKFEALSYIRGLPNFPPSDWQGRNKLPQLLLDEAYYLPIWPNLDTCLRHLRSHDITRTIWIDAVCINQDDLTERGSQVQIMQQIYARADMVKIWLGPAKEESHMGMDILKYLAHSTLQDQAPWTSGPEEALTAGLREVLQRDWFSRMWVVQEAAVSQKAIMMCGEDKFEWTNDPVQVRKFIRRIKYAAISPQWEEAGLSEVNVGPLLQVLNLQMQHIERQQKQNLTLPPDILDIAFELRHRKASDRRDKLFAIMGLVDQENGSIFQPDYTMNVESVFQRLLDSIEI
jgi:hypothetical protein